MNFDSSNQHYLDFLQRLTNTMERENIQIGRFEIMETKKLYDGIYEFYNVPFKNYRSLRNRVNTLEPVSDRFPVSIVAIAKAGFFYVEEYDKVVCFACGGGLQDWKKEDDPWYEHARWFPRCIYLLLNKGGEYVSRVRGKGERNIDGETEGKDTVDRGSRGSDNDKKTQDDVERELSLSKCGICTNNDRQIAFFPCGHVYCCIDCCLYFGKCPVCKKRITAIGKIYIT